MRVANRSSGGCARRVAFALLLQTCLVFALIHGQLIVASNSGGGDGGGSDDDNGEALHRGQNLAISVNRSIENRGFHRLLNTDIRFESSENFATNYDFDDDYDEDYYNTRPEHHCRWLIVETFEANTYVDVYELKLAKYARMYTFYMSNKVSTETAGYKSQRFQLFIYIHSDIIHCSPIRSPHNSSTRASSASSTSATANATTVKRSSSSSSKRYDCTMRIQVPIHVRYQAPSSTSKYVNFTLKTPGLYAHNCSIAQSAVERSGGDARGDERDLTPPQPTMIVSLGTATPRDNAIVAEAASHENEHNERPLATESSSSATSQVGPLDLPDTLELPCTKNTSTNNDYLIYLINYAANRNKPEMKDINTNSYLYYLVFNATLCNWSRLSFSRMYRVEETSILIPVGDSNSEPVVLVITLLVLTYLAFALAKCVRKKVLSELGETDAASNGSTGMSSVARNRAMRTKTTTPDYDERSDED